MPLLALAAGSAGLAGQSPAPSALVQVQARPAWIAHAVAIGPIPTGRRQTVTVYLAQPHATAAARFAAAVSDPHSPDYRHFLSPGQYRSRFAPGAAEATAVGDYLRAAGLRLGPTPANHLYLSASGTIASLDRAFHTSIRGYWRRGTMVSAPDGPLSVPASVAPLIAGIAGLDTSPATVQIGHGMNLAQTAPASQARPGERARPAKAAPAGQQPFTCSQYAFQNTAVLPAAYGKTVFPTQGCGYTPAQVHSAYDTSGLLQYGITGEGVKVAVLLIYPSPTAVSDVDRFSAGHGLPQLAPGQFSQYLPGSFNYGPTSGCPPVQQITDESVGDLESVHNMAPGANLVYVAASDCQPQDIEAAINETVDNHLADIVTNSYTFDYSTVPAAVVAAAHQDFIQAAAEGIGFFYSSGDFGDTSPATGTAQAGWPAADPMVTAVGGTSLFAGPDGRRELELGWGSTADPVVSSSGGDSYALPLPGQYIGGSGGGPAQGFAQPGYQQGVVPPSLAGTSDPRRFVPDVAAVADLATPVLFGITINGTYTEGGGFGTSVSCPLFAGLEALADQAAGGPHGFANPLLYLLHGTGIFHDIINVPAPVAIAVSISGTTYLDTLQADTSLQATPGYDGQTGLGSPDGEAYVAALSVFGPHHFARVPVKTGS